MSDPNNSDTAKISYISPKLRSFSRKVRKIKCSRSKKNERKCYGTKRRDLSNTCESFGLPDEHICKNTPVLLDIDASLDLSEPQDCDITLTINPPLPVECLEGVTPYWDVERYRSFKMDDIRHKIKPDNIQLEENNLEDKALDIILDSILDQANQKKKTNLDLRIIQKINNTFHSKSPKEDLKIIDLTGSQTQIILDDEGLTPSSNKHNNSFPECVKKKRGKRVRHSSLSNEFVHKETFEPFQRQLRPRNNISNFKPSQMDDSIEFSFPINVDIKLEPSSDNCEDESNGALATSNQNFNPVCEDSNPPKMSIDSFLCKVEKSPPNSPVNLPDESPLNNSSDTNFSHGSESTKDSTESNTSVMEAHEIKTERNTYSVGDLVWAKLNKYPYWPAVICEDPETKEFIKDVLERNRKPRQMYHIRFFGDCGRRCWIKDRYLMLYNSVHDLEMIAKNLKAENKHYNVVKDYLVPARFTDQWENAVYELETMKDESFGKILKFLLKCLQDGRKRKSSQMLDENEIKLIETAEKRQRKISSSKEESKEVFEEEDNEDDCQKDDKENNKKDGKENSKKDGKENCKTDGKENCKKDDKENCKKDVKADCKTDSKEDGKEDMEEPNISPNYKKSKISPKPNPKSVKVEESSASNNAVVSDVCSFEDQLALHKKNNLFNGLTRVKVCDFCFKAGNLYKCKGRCSGLYHVDCASKVAQPRIQTTSKKEGKKINKTSPQTRSQTLCLTSNAENYMDTPEDSPNSINLPNGFRKMSLEEQIDSSMQAMMKKFEVRCTNYWDINNSYSSDEDLSTNCVSSVTISDSEESTDITETSSDDLELSSGSGTKKIEHITADIVVYSIDTEKESMKCAYCRLDKDPPCFSCGLEVSERGDTARQKCCQQRCCRYYHVDCLKIWPQTQWLGVKWSKNHQPEDLFSCPVHNCHTCFAEELGNSSASSLYSRVPSDKLVKCLQCPAAFHASIYCIPAGSEILGGSQILCPRHRKPPIEPINTYWCFICSVGGNLVCCETCPTSIHPDCQPVRYTDDDQYICEDCESGRFPLYDEIVWVKISQFRWWPALVIFPNEVPESVALKRHKGDFVVRFFGTNKYYCVNKARAFLFAEGDDAGSPKGTPKLKSKNDELYNKAIEDAAAAYRLKQEFKLRREAEFITTVKPPTYLKICKNKRVGNAKDAELDLSNCTPCDCDPDGPHPCGPDSNCINRHLLTECNSDMCPAREKCENQCFQKRDYPSMVPFKTHGLGWGLKTLVPIQKGQFVIEYVGEIISTEEYQRRMKNMVEKKEENYYFMTLDGDRMIDAGPKGNLSRFMNHCCDPNCITQKWTVKGETRVGLFAKCDIEKDAELTFNYNWVGQEKKVCKCGTPSCTGFIGVKVKPDPITSVSTEPRKYQKRTKKIVSVPTIPPCFKCGEMDSDIMCNNKICDKGYHLNCLDIKVIEPSKFTCPRHNCNICSHRTTRCCVKCMNSFCPGHSDTNIRYDRVLGFVCKLHDPGESSTDKLSSSKILKEIPKQTPSEPDISTTIDKDILNSARRKQKLMKSQAHALSKTSKNTFPKRRVSLTREEQEALRLKYRMYSKRSYLKKKAERLRKRQLASEASNRPSTSGSTDSSVDGKCEGQTSEPEKIRNLKPDSRILTASTSDEDMVSPSLVANNKDKENQFMDVDDDDEISLDRRMKKWFKATKKLNKKKMKVDE